MHKDYKKTQKEEENVKSVEDNVNNALICLTDLRKDLNQIISVLFDGRENNK